MSSKHCRILRPGCKEIVEHHDALVRVRVYTHRDCVQAGLHPGRSPHHLGPAQALGANQDSTILAFLVDNASTNGTWLNGTRLSAHTPVPLRHDDLVCFAVADVTLPKCVAFRFQRFDPEVHAGHGAAAPRGVSTAAPVAHADSPPPTGGVKRVRPNDGADPQHALALHKENQALREKAAMLQDTLSQHQAKAAADAAAAAAEFAAMRDDLTAKLAAAERHMAEAMQQAAEAAEVAQAKLSEAQVSAQAEQARASAAGEAASQAATAAAEARAERDAASARLRECQAALDDARAQLRAHSESAAAVTTDLATRDAALATARAEKDAAMRRAERAEGDAQVASTALAHEKAMRATAEAAAAALSAQVFKLEAHVAREQEKARGAREGIALEQSLLSELVAFVQDVATAANAVLPHAVALANVHTSGAAAATTVAVPIPSVAVEATAAKGESQRASVMGMVGPTQHVAAPCAAPPPASPCGTAALAAPAPNAHDDTQRVGLQTAPTPVAVVEEQPLQPCEPQRGNDGAALLPVAEDMDVVPPPAEEAAPGAHDDGVFGDDENGYIPTFPSASLQAKMEAEAAAAMGDAVQRNSGPSGWDAF